MSKRKRKFQYDPRWIIAKFGYCNSCSANLRGRWAWYYPGSHSIFCEQCAKPYVEEFNNRKEEEYYAEEKS